MEDVWHAVGSEVEVPVFVWMYVCMYVCDAGSSEVGGEVGWLIGVRECCGSVQDVCRGFYVGSRGWLDWFLD